MLKEVFVIDSGILLLHYSEDRSASESDQAVLSSGFMSAIRDFSRETRSEVVESLSTENEYILFTASPNTGIITAGVFDRRASQSVATEALERIQELIASVEMPRTGIQLGVEEKNKLRNKIEQISAQLFGTNYLRTYVVEALDDRTDISLAFLIDAEKKNVIANFARPRPLFREEQVREFLLAHSTLIRALSRLEIAERYAYFTLQSPEYTVASCWSGNLLSVTSGAMKASRGEVLEAAATVCYHTSPESLTKLSPNPFLLTHATLKGVGSIAHHQGTELPSVGGVFLSTLLNNLDGFFKSVTRRSFDTFDVLTKGDSTKELVLTRKESQGDVTVRILQH
ncbi:MAG: hypothetical protein ACXADS_03045 [Candidatus Thorarchaeota archaeon]|jgi:hypothetical protein